MQPAKDSFYVELRNRLVAFDPQRTIITRRGHTTCHRSGRKRAAGRRTTAVRRLLPALG